MTGKKVTGCDNEEGCVKVTRGTETRGWDDTKGYNDKVTGGNLEVAIEMVKKVVV